MKKYNTPFTRDIALSIMESADTSARLFNSLSSLAGNVSQRDELDGMTDDEIRRFLLFSEQYRRFYGAVPPLGKPEYYSHDSLCEGIRLAAGNALNTADCLLRIYGSVTDGQLRELCLSSVLEEVLHFGLLMLMKDS